MKNFEQNFWAFINMINKLQGEQIDSDKSVEAEDYEQDSNSIHDLG